MNLPYVILVALWLIVFASAVSLGEENDLSASDSEQAEAEVDVSDFDSGKYLVS